MDEEQTRPLNSHAGGILGLVLPGGKTRQEIIVPLWVRRITQSG